MFLVGLTGGIATGKSTVSHFLRELGVLVIDCDEIAREIVAPGRPTYWRVVEAFGDDIVADDGSIARKVLGDIVFRNRVLRETLERLTHPVVMARVEERAKGEDGLVVVDVPLLFEAELEDSFDETWLVFADEQTQLRRLIKRDSLTYKQAVDRLNAQLPIQVKRSRAEEIIDNSGSKDNTRKQVVKLVTRATR